MNILLDSVILIDHFNGIRAATSYLRRTEGSSVISVITRAEVLSGFDAASAALALPLLDRFQTLPIDRDTADRAAHLRREHRWRLPDALQAALADIHGLQLATRNTRDFPPAKFKFAIEPYRL